MNQVETYIFQQTEDLRELLIALRALILKCDFNITEKISYGIPFFSRNKPFCYLNKKTNGIDIGFWSGIYFKQNSHLLELKGRKQIKTYFIANQSEINVTELNAILTEAIELDNNYSSNIDKKK